MTKLRLNMTGNFLFYGPYGAGKTRLLKTGVEDPRIFPALLLNQEAGTMSIQSLVNRMPSLTDLIKAGKELKQPKKQYLQDFKDLANGPDHGKMDKIDVMQLTCWDDLEDILDIFSSGDVPYQTLMIDSLTEINYLILREITEHAGTMNPSKHDGELSQLQDYGRLATRVRRIVRAFRDLNVNVIFTALPVDFKDDTDGSIETRPSLTGKLSDEVPGMLDIVGYMTTPKKPTEEVGRIIHFQPTGKFRAKDRSEDGKLGLSMDLNMKTKTLPRIFDLIGIHVLSEEEVAIADTTEALSGAVVA